MVTRSVNCVVIFIAGVAFGLTLSTLLHGSETSSQQLTSEKQQLSGASAAQPSSQLLQSATQGVGLSGLAEAPSRILTTGPGACLQDFHRTRQHSNGLKAQDASVTRFVMHDPTSVEMFCKLLEQYAPGGARVLEWGCGGSTLFYSRYVKDWQGVEHDSYWGGILVGHVAAQKAEFYNVNVSVTPIVHARENKEEGSYAEFAAYIEKPRELGHKFDVVLIDGRARVECANSLIRNSLLNPGAMVVVHDWQRYRKELQPGGTLSSFELVYEDKAHKRWMGFLHAKAAISA